MPLGSKSNKSSTVEWDMTITFTDGKTESYTVDQDEKDSVIMVLRNIESTNGFITFDTSDGDESCAVDIQCIRDVHFTKA